MRKGLRPQRTWRVGPLAAGRSGLGSHSFDRFPTRTGEPVFLEQTAPTFQRATLVKPTPQAHTTQSQTVGLDDDVYRRLLRERIIFLGQEVDDAISNAICAQLLLLAAEDPDREISLYINSPGGSVYSGMAIYDTMQFVPNAVATYAIGLAASMGQFLLTAGTAGKRYALPHASILMHQPHGGFGGTASDIAIQAEQMLHIKRQMAQINAERTGKSYEQIERDSDRDRWFTAQEAMEYGFIDHVYGSAEQLPSNSQS